MVVGGGGGGDVGGCVGEEPLTGRLVVEVSSSLVPRSACLPCWRGTAPTVEGGGVGGGVAPSLTTSLPSRGTAPTVERWEGGGVCLLPAGGERRTTRQAGRRTAVRAPASRLLTNILPDEAAQGRQVFYTEIIHPPL